MSIRRQVLAFTLLPLFVLLMDLGLRFPYLRLLELPLLQHFFYSFAFEWTLCFTAAWMVARLPKGQNVVTVILIILLGAVQLLVYGHYFYFGVLPNPYSINYFINHTADSVSLLLSSLAWSHALFFLILFALQFPMFRAAVNAMKHIPVKAQRILLGVTVILAAMFNNNVRFAPASYSITPATIFSVKYALQERWFGSSFEVHKGYIRRRFEIAERPVVAAPYNGILFLSESVRKKSWSGYGYQRKTTPFLDSLAAAGSVIRFERHVSNAVSTQYSVPMILSGNFTIAKTDQPFIYDYLKRWTNAKTYFFTSQSMQRSNIDLVYNTSLDTFVCQEKSPLPEFNDLGLDDAELMQSVAAFHAERRRQRFFSVIQFNNTHYPYTVKSSGKQFTSNSDSALVTDYDNTILEQDDLLRAYFASFQSSGLLDSTVILFTSDHGEAFGEHGHQGHLNTLYGEEIDIPMWIYLPPGFPAGKKEAMLMNARRNTSNQDLFPTMMELFGIGTADSITGDFSGGSLFHAVPPDRVIPVVGKDMIDTKAAIVDSMKFIETNKDGVVLFEAYNILRADDDRNNLWNRLPAEMTAAAKVQLRSIDSVSMRVDR